MFVCMICRKTSEQDPRGGWVSIKDDEDHVWSCCPNHATSIGDIAKFMAPADQILLDAASPWPISLTVDEGIALSEAIREVSENAISNAAKRPKMTTLLEEVAEAILASRGKHDDPLELELTQIAGVCINLLWQMKMGVDVANLQTRKP